MSHSPLPWSERELPDGVEPDGYRRIVDRDGRHVATVPYSTPTIKGVDIDGHANLEYLLRAVNSFGPLLTACKQAIGFCVAFREDQPCWAEHPDIGRLFANMSAVIDAHIAENKAPPHSPIQPQ